jgi:hypothetical protein
MVRRVWAKLALFAGVVAAIGAIWVPTAGATTGDVLATVSAPDAGAAFDGNDLFYTDTAGAILHSIASNGVSDQQAVPVVGAAGLQGLTYDVTRNVFWATDSTGLTVYTVDRTGLALLQFAINPLTDLPGLCGSLTGCSSTISDLAYDATDDSLWYLPVGSSRVYHIDTAGNALGYLDLGSVGCSTVSGLAAGETSLYLSGCGRVIRAAKTDTGTSSVLSSFASPVTSAREIECDDVSFAPASALWMRDRATGALRAVQIAGGSCHFGGGVALDPAKAWMTGGGKVVEAIDASGEAVEPTLGFMLHCEDLVDSNDNVVQTFDIVNPNSFTVNWGKNNGFHLDSVLFDHCGGTVTKSPTAAFNRIRGRGKGKLRLGGKSQGGFAEWELIDNNEPGNFQATSVATADQVSVVVYNSSNEVVMTTTIECSCFKGNVQAHQQG